MKYACKVYWEQSCEVEIELPDKPWTRDEVASVAIEKVEEEVGKLSIKQDKRRKFKLSEVMMVVDSVNCDPHSDVQKLKT